MATVHYPAQCISENGKGIRYAVLCCRVQVPNVRQATPPPVTGKGIPGHCTITVVAVDSLRHKALPQLSLEAFRAAILNR